jgi:deoxycytidylate deaminase
MDDPKDRREVFFALIAPIGVDLDAVEASLERALKVVAYKTNPIRLTNIFNELEHSYDIAHNNDFERYQKLIAAGDQICEDTKSLDIMALYGIECLKRHGPRGPNDEIPKGVAHIFRQVKRPAEIDTLKKVFGRNILFLSCYSSREDRKNNLVKKLLKSERRRSRTDLTSEAYKIMSIDEDERDKPAGQRVLDCFPHADFVIDCSSLSALNASIDRFVSIYFGHPFHSPTKDEYCSYFATAASYRSLDLSRQVGAAIFNEECEIISLGCNEVPKAGGGTYWCEDDDDKRDYALGRDSNQQIREDMATDALTRLQVDWLRDKYSDLSGAELSVRAFEGSNAPLKGSMIADVIEYGRMVHAEMNAITDAARSNKSTQNATLYCTTMPCHLCTKLIIASGIRRVVYLQPYPKSLVDELYTDSVAIDESSVKNKVIFETLKGVTPAGFRMAFRKTLKRKNADGSAVSWDPLEAAPSFLSYFPYYLPLEATASKLLSDAVKRIPVVPQNLPLPLPDGQH